MGMIRDGASLAIVAVLGPTMMAVRSARRRFARGPMTRCDCGNLRACRVDERWTCDGELHGSCPG